MGWQSGPSGLSALVHEARVLVGMEVAFLSRLDGQRRVIEAVAAESPAPISAGREDPAETTYCALIASGRLPQALCDATAHPLSQGLPLTSEWGIRSHVGVPVVLDDGTVYGALAAYSRALRSVDERDTAKLALVARSVTQRLTPDVVAACRLNSVRTRLTELLESGTLRCVYQPIVDVRSGAVVSVEALSRFPATFGRGPAEWFADAALTGQGLDLELAAIRLAASNLHALPPGVGLSVNASPGAVLSGAFAEWLSTVDPQRIIVEITEHEAVTEPEYEQIAAALAPWRALGLRVAIDDFGAGYASMRHTLLLSPDILKIDQSLIRDLDRDATKRSLCRALVTFAGSLAARVVAEGVETSAELIAVRRLGVDFAQGFHLAEPSPMADLPPGETPYRHVVQPSTPQQADAGITALIAELHSAGVSPASIAARLNQMGEHTPSGKRWHTASVLRALEASSGNP